MANPLFEALGGAPASSGCVGDVMRQLEQMKKTFRGDPRMEVQKLINSGQMTQAQFNQLGQMANQILRGMR